MNPIQLPGIDILLEEGPLLVVNKPTGILTQGPPAAEDTLVRRTKAFLKERESKPGNVYLGIPHRLDRAVSGAVLFAKNSKAAARLAEQFRDRQVRKIYWAIVSGCPEPASGSLVDWIEKVPDLPKAWITDELTPTAREASLRYRVLGSVPAGTLVEIELLTGRFHQIRCQLAHHGWPIVGDRLYEERTGSPDHQPSLDPPSREGQSQPPFIPPSKGGQRGVEDPSHAFTEEAIALHARSLGFLHPIRYEPVHVTAPPPLTWGTIVESISADTGRLEE